MKRPPSNHPADNRAFALVLVLVIVSVLALVAVGFLASMSQERATASAFANKARAEQSAQAGVDTAMGILKDYFRAFPDSATVWEAQSKNPGKQSSDSDYSNEGTTLYFHAVANGNNQPDPAPTTDTNANSANGNGPNNVDGNGVDARPIFALSLVSGATVQLATNKSNALPTLTADAVGAPGNSVDLNSRRYNADSQGWLGTSPFYTYPPNTSNINLPKPVRVPWVDIKQRDGIAAGETAPVVARYAFWVEDESFRTNISYADNGQTAASPRRDNSVNAALNPTDISLLGMFTSLDAFFDGKTQPAAHSDPQTERSMLMTARQAYPGGVFSEPRAFAHATGLTTATDDALRYLATSTSAALNLSRHGSQRLNLNAVVPQDDLPADTAQATAVIQGQVDRIVAAIKFHTPSAQIPGSNPPVYASYFGERFFRTSAATDATTLNALQVPIDSNQYSLIYLYKIAANIRDYIDKDPTPTIINAGGTVRYGINAGHPFAGPSGLDGANEIWAQGKDSAPCLEEAATRFRGGHLASDASKYQVAIDYYVEAWNSCNQDVYASALGPHPVVRVANPTQWVSTSTNDPSCPSTDPAPANASPSDTRVSLASRDYDIDLVNNVKQIVGGASIQIQGGVVFKAGVATVITTDPQYAQIITDANAQKNVYLCGFYPAAPDPNATGKRIYNGTLPHLSSGSGYAAGLKMRFQQPSSSASSTEDYNTEIILKTDNNVIDSTYGGLPIYYIPTSSGIPFYLTQATQPDPNLSEPTTGKRYYGGSMHGNKNTSSYPSVTGDPRSNNEQLVYTKYKAGGISDQTSYFYAAEPGTLGLPNSSSSPDLTAVQPAGTGAYTPWPDYYSFPADNLMSAASAPYVIANSALTSIGQLGDIYDPLRVATSSANVGNARGGGRTLAIGQHDDRWDGSATSASRSWTSWRLADFFCVSNVMEQPGLININGVARDNGAALRAAVGGPNGFKFQPTTSGTGQPAGDSLTADTTTPGLQTVINQIKARLATASPATYSAGYSASDNTGSGPFFERGELSELPAFGHSGTTGTTSTDLVNGVNMATVFDREREELFRRLAEMITTRGNVFTVYAIGQSLVPTTSNSRQVLGTQQLRVTFKLVPKDKTGADFHPAVDANGNPTTWAANNPNDRFAKPDHYDVQVLSSSNGSN